MLGQRLAQALLRCGALAGRKTALTRLTPQSSYGTQKAIGELLVNDYSRKGFIDGRAIRLPTIVVRPGRPNRATSTFASSIIREPLQGRSAVCPVSAETRDYVSASGRREFHPGGGVGRPGGTITGLWLCRGYRSRFQEMVDSLREIAGPAAVERISWQPAPFIQKTVGGWLHRFAPTQAEALGFRADGSMTEIIQAFIDDDVEGENVGVGRKYSILRPPLSGPFTAATTSRSPAAHPCESRLGGPFPWPP